MTSPFWPGSNIVRSQRNAFDWKAQPSELNLKGAKTIPKPTTDFKKFAVYSKATPKEAV